MKIYFAGPMVFHPAVHAIDAITKSVCKAFNVEPLIPTDTEIRESGTPREIATDIFSANVAHIRNCDAIIANITPFRGACLDDGTSWEIGMAYALDKKIYTYSYGPQNTKEIISTHCGVTDESASPLRDKEGYMIENFGLPANLMISCATHAHFAAEGNFPEHYEALLTQILTTLTKEG